MNLKQSTDQSKGGVSKGLLLFNVLIFISLITFICINTIPNLILSYERLNDKALYISFQNWEPSFVVFLPGLMAALSIIFLRLFNLAKDIWVNVLMKIMIIFLGAGILLRIIMIFLAPYYLEQKNYSFCWHYTAPNLMSRSTWVNSAAICVDDTGNLRKEILSWMDTLPNNGKDVSEGFINAHIKDMLKEYRENK